MLDLVLSGGTVVTPAGPVPAGAVGVAGDRIGYVGPAAAAPAARRIIDAGGGLIAPGFIDAHTHLVFAGDRAGEFAARAAGKGYAEILAAGGGILATVR